MNFDSFTHRVNNRLASPTAFVLSLISVVVWAVCGPIFHYSETWQLVVNTSTTIITFWMAFVILSASKRDNAALQLKPDALIKANEHVSNRLMAMEERTSIEIEAEVARVHEVRNAR
jgi:low affinity Fe/Cu permease